MFALLLLTQLGLAGSISTHPSTETPPWSQSTKLHYTVEWIGEAPKKIEVQIPLGPWTELEIEELSFVTTPALPPGSILRVDNETIWPLNAFWSPLDFARWSGPGLRGALVHDLLMGTELLWAATGYGGIAQWDGQEWLHIEPIGLSQLLPIVQVTNTETELVLGGKGGVAFLNLEGQLRIVSVDGQVLNLLSNADGLWVNTTEGIYEIRGDVADPILKSPHCQGLFNGFNGALWAQCNSLIELPVETYIPGIESQWTVNDVEILPEGVWLAVDGNGLIWWEPDRVESLGWNTDQKHITRVGQELFTSPGQTIIHLSGQDRRVYDTADGLPSNTITDLIPGPNQKVWAATNRGVALVDPHGIATPLPLAPVPVNIPIYDIAPTKMGVGMATARGLVWLGMRAPKGWASFSAALGPNIRGIESTEHGWWGYTAHPVEPVIIQLDRRGILHRWPSKTPLTSPVLGLHETDEQIIIHQVNGIRTWLPGASMLSTVDYIPSQLAEPSPDGSIWLANSEQVTQKFQGSSQSFDLASVVDIVAGFGVAWAASDAGVARLGLDNSITVISEEPTMKLAIHGEALWQMRQDGHLCGPTVQEARCYDLFQEEDGFQVNTLVADEYGVWVGTSRGAYRILSSQ